MSKTFSVEDITWAFIEHASDADHAVAISMAGTPWGYVRIKGPGGKHQVVIERYNASVCLSEVHSTLPGAELRPNSKITDHPLGYSSGPTMDPFRWGISAQTLRKRYQSASDFVAAIVGSCGQASPW